LSGIEYRFLGSPVCSAVPFPSKEYKSDKHLPKYVSPTCIARLSEKLPIQKGYANTADGISDGCLQNFSYSLKESGSAVIHLTYKDECLFVCLFVCLYVCMYLIQIHISEPIWTKLCTRLPLGLEETVRYVWARNSWPLRPSGHFFFRGHYRIMGTRWLPARPFAAISLYPWFQLVFAWRHRHYVIAGGGVIRGSVIYPWF
jgi:hypothetical protein